MKPLKVEAVKLYYWNLKSWLPKEWTKGPQERNLESKLQLSLLTRSTQSPNSNFPFNCWAFSLLELMICIETAFYWNERYLFVTWFIFFLSRTCWNHVLKKQINSLYLNTSPDLNCLIKSYIRFLVRLCIHNINFWSDKFWFIQKKNKCMGL